MLHEVEPAEPVVLGWGRTFCERGCIRFEPLDHLKLESGAKRAQDLVIELGPEDPRGELTDYPGMTTKPTA